MKINKILKSWYEENGRDLPWRKNQNPYSIWVSEIILQQTRVAQGEAYYRRFIQCFPDVKSLASADIDEVLKVWQGLGYYSRARNMHEAAQYINKELQGCFPRNYQELLKLKGVGRYTAGAVASIAYREPVAAIDGNVNRIFSRLYGIEGDLARHDNRKLIEGLVSEQMDRQRPDIFNQALMDFGSLVCRPKNPPCSTCPLSSGCTAYLENRVQELPGTAKKTRSRKRFFYYMVLLKDGHFFLEQRKNEDIWKLLYQFPLVETTRPLSDEEVLLNMEKKFPSDLDNLRIESISEEYKHVLSHQKIFARFVIIHPGSNVNEDTFSDLKKVPVGRIRHFAVPRLIDRFVNNFVSLHFK